MIVYHNADIATWRGRWRLLRQLRGKRFDLWIELPRNLAGFWLLLRNMLFARLAGARWAGGWRLSSVRLWPRTQSSHLRFPNEVERLLTIIREEGIGVGALDYGLASNPTLANVAKDLLRRSSIAGGQAVVALAPGAKRSTNRWPLERWIEVGRSLRERGHKIVLVGSAADHGVCRVICEGIGAAENLAGQTKLPVLAELLRHCRFVVCVDSGVQHIAAAVGIQCVSLMAARDYQGKWYPQGQHIVIEKRVGCHTCLLERCPNNNLCMREISVPEVIEACNQIGSTRATLATANTQTPDACR
jgi:ADP-heptose:LPS heptosyltransferase